MTVKEDLDLTLIEKDQRESTFAGRSVLESCTNHLNDCDNAIQALVDSGKFDTIPNELKQTLNEWWTIIKTARADIEANDDIVTAKYWPAEPPV